MAFRLLCCIKNYCCSRTLCGERWSCAGRCADVMTPMPGLRQKNHQNAGLGGFLMPRGALRSGFFVRKFDESRRIYKQMHILSLKTQKCSSPCASGNNVVRRCAERCAIPCAAPICLVHLVRRCASLCAEKMWIQFFY